MGWKPNTTKSLELGEIPHKKELTAEQQANMREFAPDRDELEAFEEFNKSRADFSAGLETMQDSEAIKSVIAHIEQNINHPFYSGEFSIEVDDFINENYEELDTDQVLEIYYSLKLKPTDFYFSINVDPDPLNPSGYFIIVTPKDLWDKEGIIDDHSLADYVIPESLERIQESIYDWNHDEFTPSKIRRELLKNGFIEHDIK